MSGSDGNARFGGDFWATALPAIAVAADEGGAAYYARRYQKILERDGIKLEVRQTGGSQANVKLLADPSSGVDAARCRGG